MAALAADAWVCRFPSLDIVQLPPWHATCVAQAGAVGLSAARSPRVARSARQRFTHASRYT